MKRAVFKEEMDFFPAALEKKRHSWPKVDVRLLVKSYSE